MRLHKNLCLAVIDGLNRIFNEGEYADKAVQAILKRDKRWGSRDRGFIAETMYEIVRYKRLYAEIARVNEPFDRNDLWRLFAVWAVLRGIKLPDWPNLEGTPVRRFKGRFDELRKTRKIRESVPDWLDELGAAELGEAEWEKELNTLNNQATVVLRVNTLKTSKQSLQEKLASEGIDTVDLVNYPDAIQLKERANVFRTSAFKSGLFEVQDASSQLVSAFCDVQPGLKVVDACAGAGGKSLHLAALMGNKGNIIAMDVSQSKLNQLKKRAKRNGVHNITVRLIDSTKPIKKLTGQADRLLIDAPCSGLGVLRRNPDAKWKLDPDFIKQVQSTQQQILSDYSKMVKPGGLLIYATCSILPSENQEQVKKFLDSEMGKEFIFVKDRSVSSSKSGFDGFYMAQLQKKNN